jgi:hypothetical protein
LERVFKGDAMAETDKACHGLRGAVSGSWIEEFGWSG